MAFWCRINQSRLNHITHQFKRYYIRAPSLDHSASRTKNSETLRPFCENPVKKPTDFCNNVRFFAAPVQPRKEDKEDSGLRLNDKIPAQFIRLVLEEGHKVVSRHEALALARELKQDLVEVDRNAKPPVCKIMDFHKEQYQKELKEKDRSKAKSDMTLKKGDCKEVKFSGKIEQKDLQMKADTVKRLMEKGYRVKCMALPVSRKEETEDLGGYLSRLIDLIEDVSIVESGPHVERKQAYVLIRHVKFGPSKKGGAKKLKALKAIGNTGAAMHDPAEMRDEKIEKKNTAWSVSNSSNEHNEVFDPDDDMKEASSKSKVMNAVPETARPPANLNASNFSHPKPVTGFSRTNTPQSSPQEPSVGTGNRYARSEPRNQFPQKPVDNPGPRMRESFRSEPQFPNQRRQQPPPNMDAPPPVDNLGPRMRESFRSEPQFPNQRRQQPPPNMNAPPPVDNLGPRMRESFRSEPQFPNQRRQQPPPNMNAPPPVGEKKPVGTEASAFRNSKLPDSLPKQVPPRPDVPNTRASGFGIFSNPTAGNYRNKEGIPTSSTAGVGTNQNTPGLKSDGSQRPSPDNGGQGKFGIFSR